MARPTTKMMLITLANEQFDRMCELVSTIPKQEREAAFLFEDRDRNLRDIFIHLYEWHQLLLNWVRNNQSGQPAPFLAPPYNWKTYPEMNLVFWQQHQQTPLGDAENMLKQSHANVMALIESFSNEALFTKKYFNWTGTTSLGSYCVSATSSHYDWAIKKIKKHIQTQAAASSDGQK